MTIEPPVSPDDIEDVRKEWPARLARVLRVRARIDTTGMTRPARDPVKRAFLEQMGQAGPFQESEGRRGPPEESDSTG